MSIDDILRDLDQAERKATPGPWLHDYGNWDVESRHPEFHRSEICKQPDTDEHHPGTDVHADMMFIELARNHMRDLLCYVAELQMKLRGK